jgi:hypothetical protein
MSILCVVIIMAGGRILVAAITALPVTAATTVPAVETVRAAAGQEDAIITVPAEGIGITVLVDTIVTAAITVEGLKNDINIGFFSMISIN